MGVFEGIGLGDLGVFSFKCFLRNMWCDENVKGFFKIGEAAKNLEIFFGSEVVSLVSVAH